MSKEESKEEKKVADVDARAVAVNARALKFFAEGAVKGADKMQKSLAEAEAMCVRHPCPPPHPSPPPSFARSPAQPLPPLPTHAPHPPPPPSLRAGRG